MKSLFVSTLLIGFLTQANLVAAKAAEDIVLRGVLDLGTTRTFSLSESNGQSSTWRKIGQNFKGYKLEAFDSESQSLELSKGGESFTLGIASKQAERDTESNGTAESRLAEADAIISKMNFSEMIDKTMESQMKATEKMMMQQMGATDMDPDIVSDQVQKTMGIMKQFFTEIDWEPVEEGMAKVYAETFTQSELEAISNFYATPAGIATIEKQPEIQQRMSEIMMPMIMQANQKMMNALHQQ